MKDYKKEFVGDSSQLGAMLGNILSENSHNATDEIIDGMNLFRLKAMQTKNVDFAQAKGNLFEYIESAKFNKDAALKKSSVRAVVTDASWNAFNVEKEFNEISDFRVKVGNDANVAALGEMWQGAGKGYQDVLMVTLGTGVGGGCVLDGKIVSGIHGAGGEIGHMPVKDDEPIACNCGNHGCLEQYVSATGIVTQAKKTLEQDTRSSSLRNYASLEAKNIYDEAKNGDEIANEAVNLTCKILAKSLAQVCCVIDPEIIVIGGGVSKAGDILTSRISTFFKEYAFHACENTPIVLAKLENDAGMYGCVKSLF